jgi:molecular chaperone DnaK (HSP70)/ribosomal protein L7/L12
LPGQPDEIAAPIETAPPSSAGSDQYKTPQPPQPEVLGYQLTLAAVAPQARGRVLLALRQVLGLTPADAQAYVSSAPILLAVGLSPDMAETLSAALKNAGAQITIQAPPPPPEKEKSSQPSPEPKRRLRKQAETVQKFEVRQGLRTVTGLDIGKTYSYLAFCRAEGERLSAAPEMVRFEAQTAIPTALQPAREGYPFTYGDAALIQWVKAPETVHLGLLDQIGEMKDEDILPSVRKFFEVLARRLDEVLMPGALSMVEGASTTIGIPTEWDQGRIERLMDAAVQAGFPINRFAPRPLAALTFHLQQGTLTQRAGKEKTLVIDWGGSSLCLSFVENGSEMIKPQVFEHIEVPLGGAWFDDIIRSHLLTQLPADLNEEDRRSLVLFTRSFKDQMSRAFTDGRNSHTQYCVIPAGAPPTRLRMTQAEFEEKTAEGREQFRRSLVNAVADIGLKPEHLNHVIVCGGGARWYFVREAIRSTLEQIPLIAANPEESVARGLAAYRLIF